MISRWCRPGKERGVGGGHFFIIIIEEEEDDEEEVRRRRREEKIERCFFRFFACDE